MTFSLHRIRKSEAEQPWKHIARITSHVRRRPQAATRAQIGIAVLLGAMLGAPLLLLALIALLAGRHL